MKPKSVSCLLCGGSLVDLLDVPRKRTWPKKAADYLLGTVFLAGLGLLLAIA